MANTTSGAYTFDKTFAIDDIIEDAYERIGLQGVSGYQLKTAKRSLNLLFSEWGNRELHYWEVANQNLKIVDGVNTYNFYRTTADGTQTSRLSTTLSAIISSASATTGITLTSVANLPTSGLLIVDTEQISYTGFSSTELTGVVRGANGTTAATHSNGATIYQFVSGMDDIMEASYRNGSNVDAPLTKVSRSQYQAYSNKTSEGTPTSYFVERFIDRVTMTLYLTPGAAEDGNHINFYYQKRIQDAGDAYTNAADVPYRFAPCMTAGLAFYLSQKYAPQRSQELKLFYEDELARALSEDGSSSSTFIAPKTYYPGT
jgi:hypothetical protein